jgi:hypothetical protein
MTRDISGQIWRQVRDTWDTNPIQTGDTWDIPPRRDVPCPELGHVPSWSGSERIDALVHLCITCAEHLCRWMGGKKDRPDEPPHEREPARRVGLAHAFRLAIRSLTNEFVIRDSANASNRDKHLAAPSNDSLTAVGYCSVLRGAP